MALTPTDLGDNTGAAVSSITLAGVTVSAGGLLVVPVGIFDPFDSAVVTGVTFDGTPMTQTVAKKGTIAGDAWCHVSQWELISAGGGTGDIVATFDAAATNCVIGAIEFTGYDAGSPTGATGSTDSNTDAAPTASLACAVGDCLVAVKAAENYGTNEVPDAAQTVIFDNNTFSISYKIADSNPETMSETDTTNAGWVYAAIVVTADAGGGGGGYVHRRQLNGGARDRVGY